MDKNIQKVFYLNLNLKTETLVALWITHLWLEAKVKAAVGLVNDEVRGA